VAYGLAVKGQHAIHDDAAFRDVIHRMHGGEDYYHATVDAFLRRGTRVGSVRAFRLPTVFLLWRVLPTGWLYPGFIAVVVIGTSFLLLFVTTRPWIVPVVTLYLAHAGRILSLRGRPQLDEWLLVELWTVPVIAAFLLAVKRERWWWAAGLGAAAFLVRELAGALLVGGALSALLYRRSLRPWLAAAAVAGVLYVGHAVLAADAALPHGTDAKLAGSGQFPRTVLEMMSWPIPGPKVIGLALWVLALVWLARKHELVLYGPLMAIPAFGLIVDRSYWGLLVVPFTLFWSLELVAEEFARFRTRRHAVTPRA
jgi:hypothetical protein